MQMTDRKVTFRILRYILRPVVSFCLKHGLRLQDLIECAKEVFVAVATPTLEAKVGKVQGSRLSAMTGVHRRDIARIKSPMDSESSYEKDLVTRVVGLWQTHPRFRTVDRMPRILSADGSDSEFAALVGMVSSDLKPGAVLFELKRTGTVEARPKGVALVKGSFVPKGNIDVGFRVLSEDLDDLSKAVEENILADPKIPNLHARTQYDNVRPEGIAELKSWFLREGHNLHLKAREIISKYDQDVNPDPKFSGKPARIVMGTFSFVESPDEE